MTDRFGYQPQPDQINSSPIRGSSLGGGGNPPPAGIASPDDTRDRIINTYREEIKNHQARERDYKILQEVLNDLQRRSRALENDIAAQQRDHEDRVRDQQKTVQILQGELENTKKQIKDRQDEGITIHDQTQ
jgi:septal ring factor EnvC (AmiA/AmiB activator)